MAMLPIIVVALLASWASHSASAANILAILPTPSPSHHMWNSVLMTTLARRGHTVTVVSPDPEKKPVANHKDIVLEGTYELIKVRWDYSKMDADGPITATLTTFEWGTAMCEHWMNTKGFQTLLASNETYDLIIMEVVVDECFFGVVPHFNNPPVIGVTAFTHPPWASPLTGDMETPSYIPAYLAPFTDRMSFGERVANALMYAFVNVYRSYVYLPRIDEIARASLGADLPPVSQLEKNFSLVMVNSHFSFDYPRPLMPAMVPVGGLHIRPVKPLPQELQRFLDDATDGVIYFSLGSNIRSEQLNSAKLAMFLEAFRQLPRQRVLWKWEASAAALADDVPSNVRLERWLPQNDVLAHPNVRLFITHGGLLSTQEALFHGVPIVGVPFIIDQHTNVHKALAHGVGERVDYATLSQRSLLDTLRKVLDTPSYRENMQRLSAQFRDQPQPALERAVFWTEYVLRHGGAAHLRSAGADLAWYRYWLVDVLAAFTVAVAALLAAGWLAARRCATLVRRRGLGKEKSK